MRKNDLVSLALLVMPVLFLGAAEGGCTVEDVPAHPTFEADILPITLSRCVRCHGAGGTLNADPDHTGILAGQAPLEGYFNMLNDDCGDGGADGGAAPMCKYGLLHYAMPPATVLKGYIHSTSDATRMPPPPSPTLTSRQLEIFDRWLAETPPM